MTDRDHPGRRCGANFPDPKLVGPAGNRTIRLPSATSQPAGLPAGDEEMQSAVRIHGRRTLSSEVVDVRENAEVVDPRRLKTL
jgi:hypothetical protein